MLHEQGTVGEARPARVDVASDDDVRAGFPGGTTRHDVLGCALGEKLPEPFETRGVLGVVEKEKKQREQEREEGGRGRDETREDEAAEHERVDPGPGRVRVETLDLHLEPELFQAALHHFRRLPLLVGGGAAVG